MNKWGYPVLIGVAAIVVGASAAWFHSPGTIPALTSERISEPLNESELAIRVGQMVMVGFRGTSLEGDSSFVRAVRRGLVGGVILFDTDIPSGLSVRNVVSPAQVRTLTTALQSLAPTPLFIAVDAEGGRVNRLSPDKGFMAVPSAQRLGVGTPEQTGMIAGQLAEQLRGLGITMNMAPVVDVHDGASPIIGKLGRAFSSDPATVIAHARAFIAAQREKGVVSVIKHFPGHGSARGDTHESVVDVTDTYIKQELEPFAALAKEPFMAVMSGHLFNQLVDADNPVSLSRLFIEKILRKQLKFSGVVISDDLHMKAISERFTVQEAAVAAVLAGNDIVLFSNNADVYDEQLAVKVHAALMTAVRDGRISEARIRESSDRIAALKAAVAKY